MPGTIASGWPSPSPSWRGRCIGLWLPEALAKINKSSAVQMRRNSALSPMDISSKVRFSAIIRLFSDTVRQQACPLGRCGTGARMLQLQQSGRLYICLGATKVNILQARVP